MSQSSTQLKVPAKTQAELSPSALAAEFEMQCINLLFKQDQLVDSMGEQEPGAGVAGSLDVGFQILAEFLDFVDESLEGEQAEEVLALIRDLHDRTKRLKQAHTQSSWGGVQRLWGAKAPAPAELQELHRQLGADLGALCGEVFGRCAGRFRSTEYATRFCETAELLRSELEFRW